MSSPEMSPTREKKWTVMIYLAGDNNLDAAGLKDLKEMKTVGSTKEVDVIAQVDRFGGNHATHRYHLQKGSTLDADSVQSLGETNMGDPKVLEEFLRWGMRNHPAQRFVVVLWNHGSGWDDEDIYRTAERRGIGITRRGDPIEPPSDGEEAVSVRRLRTVGGNRFKRALFETTIATAIAPGSQNRAIAFDDTSKDFLDNIEMKNVLTAATRELGREIDILGMDACLMSMAEVAYQVRDTALVTVGSEELEPGDGWPYDAILKELTTSPDMNAKDLGQLIVKKYLAAYDDDAKVTQAACDLTKCEDLARKVNGLAEAMTAKVSERDVKAALVEARSQVQEYDVTEYIDLYNFCDLLAEKVEGPLRTACTEVMDFIREPGFVLSSGYKGATLQHSYGVAIYFPHRKEISPLYKTLDFTKNTTWGAFLKAYNEAIRQPDRHPGRRSAARPSPERAAEV